MKLQITPETHWGEVWLENRRCLESESCDLLMLIASPLRLGETSFKIDFLARTAHYHTPILT